MTRFATWICCALVLFVGCHETRGPGVSLQFESEIIGFEKQDKVQPPPERPILFVGSSTIRFWDLAESFPGQPVLNRGFGGSQAEDAVYYFSRVVEPYRPSTVVFYSGDNDLAYRKTPQEVVADYRQFITLLRNHLPGTKLVVISIKPSVARWNIIEQAREANREIEKLVRAYPGGVFLNIEPDLLGPDGKPRGELFVEDGLHLSPKGYALLNNRVAPYLAEATASADLLTQNVK